MQISFANMLINDKETRPRFNIVPDIIIRDACQTKLRKQAIRAVNKKLKRKIKNFQNIKLWKPKIQKDSVKRSCTIVINKINN